MPLRPNDIRRQLVMLAQAVLDEAQSNADAAETRGKEDDESTLPCDAGSSGSPPIKARGSAKTGDSCGAPADAAPQATASDENAQGPRVPVPKGPITLPAIQAMREVGYLASAGEMRDVWAWAKAHSPEDGVWPTPTAGVQEAMTFDACGWPNPNTTAAEWLSMLTYWTVLREQLIGGAPRRARGKFSV